MILKKQEVSDVLDAGEAASPDSRLAAVDRWKAPRPRGIVGLFPWDHAGWGLGQEALLIDLSAGEAAVVLDQDAPLPAEGEYALRLPRGNLEPLWVMCAVAWQKELGRGLICVGFRFASQFCSAAAA